MRANRSRLHSFGAIGITAAVLCGASASVATAKSVMPTVAPNAPTLSLVVAGGASASTGQSAPGTGSGATATRVPLGALPAGADSRTVARSNGQLPPSDPNRSSRRQRVTPGDAPGELSNPTTGTTTGDSGSAVTGTTGDSVSPDQSPPQATATPAPITPSAPATAGPSSPSAVRGAVPPADRGLPADRSPTIVPPTAPNAGPGSTGAPAPNPVAAAPGATRCSGSGAGAMSTGHCKGTPPASGGPARSTSYAVGPPPPRPAPPAPGPVATAPTTVEPPHTQPVATGAVATGPVATGAVATEPVATPPISVQTAPVPGRQVMPRLHRLQTLVTRWLRTGKHGAPAFAPLHPPVARPSLLAVAAGWRQDAPSFTDAVIGKAARAPAARHLERSSPPAVPGSRRITAGGSTAEVAADAPPAQRLLPIGGPTATGASGGLGSAAPPVAAVFAALALSLATILLAPLSLDLASWRSTLLTSRLEHPG